MSGHPALLSDRRSVRAYARAIRRGVRPGDRVVDLGCGTGILGFLELRAGARHVTAVERSPVLRTARRLRIWMEPVNGPSALGGRRIAGLSFEACFLNRPIRLAPGAGRALGEGRPLLEFDVARGRRPFPAEGSATSRMRRGGVLNGGSAGFEAEPAPGFVLSSSTWLGE